MNPHRIGRPPSADPKGFAMRIRLTSSERQKLESCSNALGKTKADIIRQGIEQIFQELARQDPLD